MNIPESFIQSIFTQVLRVMISLFTSTEHQRVVNNINIDTNRLNSTSDSVFSLRSDAQGNNNVDMRERSRVNQVPTNRFDASSTTTNNNNNNYSSFVFHENNIYYYGDNNNE